MTLVVVLLTLLLLNLYTLNSIQWANRRISVLESFVLKKEKQLTSSLLDLNSEFKRALVRYGFNGSTVDGQIEPRSVEQVMLAF